MDIFCVRDISFELIILFGISMLYFGSFMGLSEYEIMIIFGINVYLSVENEK